jgi:hypothetical protein
MAQSQTPDDDEARERVSATELNEGDRVFMGINLHGSSDGLPGVEYDRDNYQSGVEGTVTKALSDTDKELLDDGRRPMADLKVEADDGTVYNWNVDNGYVIGPNTHDEGPSRTDVGKIGGFYQ